ncbi:hypothetical protein Cadr_000003881 [Camelus dromedarius]|uniref:Uncharacterized protein n=1 Tax=Camelus dromedarius TaxID=9838 RepID=A0A5N4ECH2_CAMDR|nr:hypothetical protein Cadr_000003881 [Camelus dromedarius]
MEGWSSIRAIKAAHHGQRAAHQCCTEVLPVQSDRNKTQEVRFERMREGAEHQLVYTKRFPLSQTSGRRLGQGGLPGAPAVRRLVPVPTEPMPPVFRAAWGALSRRAMWVGWGGGGAGLDGHRVGRKLDPSAGGAVLVGAPRIRPWRRGPRAVLSSAVQVLKLSWVRPGLGTWGFRDLAVGPPPVAATPTHSFGFSPSARPPWPRLSPMASTPETLRGTQLFSWDRSLCLHFPLALSPRPPPGRSGQDRDSPSLRAHGIASSRTSQRQWAGSPLSLAGRVLVGGVHSARRTCTPVSPREPLRVPAWLQQRAAAVLNETEGMCRGLSSVPPAPQKFHRWAVRRPLELEGAGVEAPIPQDPVLKRSSDQHTDTQGGRTAEDAPRRGAAAEASSRTWEQKCVMHEPPSMRFSVLAAPADQAGGWDLGDVRRPSSSPGQAAWSESAAVGVRFFVSVVDTEGHGPASASAIAESERHETPAARSRCRGKGAPRSGKLAPRGGKASGVSPAPDVQVWRLGWAFLSHPGTPPPSSQNAALAGLTSVHCCLSQASPLSWRGQVHVDTHIHVCVHPCCTLRCCPGALSQEEWQFQVSPSSPWARGWVSEILQTCNHTCQTPRRAFPGRQKPWEITRGRCRHANRRLVEVTCQQRHGARRPEPGGEAGGSTRWTGLKRRGSLPDPERQTAPPERGSLRLGHPPPSAHSLFCTSGESQLHSPGKEHREQMLHTGSGATEPGSSGEAPFRGGQCLPQAPRGGLAQPRVSPLQTGLGMFPRCGSGLQPRPHLHFLGEAGGGGAQEGPRWVRSCCRGKQESWLGFKLGGLCLHPPALEPGSRPSQPRLPGAFVTGLQPPSSPPEQADSPLDLVGGGTPTASPGGRQKLTGPGWGTLPALGPQDGACGLGSRKMQPRNSRRNILDLCPPPPLFFPRPLPRPLPSTPVPAGMSPSHPASPAFTHAHNVCARDYGSSQDMALWSLPPAGWATLSFLAWRCPDLSPGRVTLNPDQVERLILVSGIPTRVQLDSKPLGQACGVLSAGSGHSTPLPSMLQNLHTPHSAHPPVCIRHTARVPSLKVGRAPWGDRVPGRPCGMVLNLGSAPSVTKGTCPRTWFLKQRVTPLFAGHKDQSHSMSPQALCWKGWAIWLVRLLRGPRLSPVNNSGGRSPVSTADGRSLPRHYSLLAKSCLQRAQRTLPRTFKGGETKPRPEFSRTLSPPGISQFALLLCSKEEEGCFGLRTGVDSITNLQVSSLKPPRLAWGEVCGLGPGAQARTKGEESWAGRRPPPLRGAGQGGFGTPQGVSVEPLADPPGASLCAEGLRAESDEGRGPQPAPRGVGVHPTTWGHLSVFPAQAALTTDFRGTMVRVDSVSGKRSFQICRRPAGCCPCRNYKHSKRYETAVPLTASPPPRGAAPQSLQPLSPLSWPPPGLVSSDPSPLSWESCPLTLGVGAPKGILQSPIHVPQVPGRGVNTRVRQGRALRQEHRGCDGKGSGPSPPQPGAAPGNGWGQASRLGSWVCICSSRKQGPFLEGAGFELWGPAGSGHHVCEGPLQRPLDPAGCEGEGRPGSSLGLGVKPPTSWGMGAPVCGPGCKGRAGATEPHLATQCIGPWTSEQLPDPPSTRVPHAGPDHCGAAAAGAGRMLRTRAPSCGGPGPRTRVVPGPRTRPCTIQTPRDSMALVIGHLCILKGAKGRLRRRRLSQVLCPSVMGGAERTENDRETWARRAAAAARRAPDGPAHTGAPPLSVWLTPLLLPAPRVLPWTQCRAEHVASGDPTSREPADGLPGLLHRICLSPARGGCLAGPLRRAGASFLTALSAMGVPRVCQQEPPSRRSLKLGRCTKPGQARELQGLAWSCPIPRRETGSGVRQTDNTAASGGVLYVYSASENVTSSRSRVSADVIRDLEVRSSRFPMLSLAKSDHLLQQRQGSGLALPALSKASRHVTQENKIRFYSCPPCHAGGRRTATRSCCEGWGPSQESIQRSEEGLKQPAWCDLIRKRVQSGGEGSACWGVRRGSDTTTSTHTRRGLGRVFQNRVGERLLEKAREQNCRSSETAAQRALQGERPPGAAAHLWLDKREAAVFSTARCRVRAGQEGRRGATMWGWGRAKWV